MTEATTSKSVEETLVYSGLLSLSPYGEADDILFLSSEEDPLAEVLDGVIDGKQVSVRYWLADKPCSREEAEEDALRTIMGAADTRFGARYSDYTGYLWTDEEVKIGGHDLIAELKDAAGKWLILEIVVHGAS